MPAGLPMPLCCWLPLSSPCFLLCLQLCMLKAACCGGQVVKSQTQQALEVADQMQKLQKDSSQLAATEQDLQLRTG